MKNRNPSPIIIAKCNQGYFTDTGFACYLQRISTSGIIDQHPFSGRLAETFIIMEIIKTIQSWTVKANLYHFRTYAGAEVDLVLEINSILYPIEIKTKSNTRLFIRRCLCHTLVVHIKDKSSLWLIDPPARHTPDE